MCELEKELNEVAAQMEAADSTASRMSAKGVLLDRVFRLRRRADFLEQLANELPDDLSQQADEALWKLVVECHRSGL